MGRVGTTCSTYWFNRQFKPKMASNFISFSRAEIAVKGNMLSMGLFQFWQLALLLQTNILRRHGWSTAWWFVLHCPILVCLKYFVDNVPAFQKYCWRSFVNRWTSFYRWWSGSLKVHQCPFQLGTSWFQELVAKATFSVSSWLYS